MIIGTRQKLSNLSQSVSVFIDGKVLKEVESKKTLGVLVDKHMCWHKQIDNISKKALEGIGMLRRVKPYVSTETRKHLYRSLIAAI
jgi:hypothetical protein